MRHLLIFDTANAEMLKRVIRLLLLLFFKGKGFRPLKLTFLIASFLCYCYELKQRYKKDTTDCVIRVLNKRRPPISAALK